jgi:phosphate starvation-inducible PhoH-like protein
MSSNHHTDEIFKEKRKPKNPIKFNLTLNEEQKLAKEEILNNHIIAVKGKAGSGKTMTSLQVGLDLLFKKEIDKIIIARPYVTAGEDIGFLPGGVEDKLSYLTSPIYTIIEELVGKEKQEKLISDGNVIVAPFGFLRGNAQSLDSKIYTPTGYKTMGEIEVGDIIFTDNGETTEVTAIYPQGEKDMYKISFTDGSFTECCDEHLWAIKRTITNQKTNKWEVKHLKDFKDDIKHYYQNKWKIPIVSSPVQFTSNEYTLDPYTLGCLLSDQTIIRDSHVEFTTDYPEILNNIKLPYEYYVVPQDNNYEIITDEKGKSLNSYLMGLGLANLAPHLRFIPTNYIYNTPEVRLELLRGLLDSTSFITTKALDNKDIIHFSTVSLELIKGLTELVNSLGGVIFDLKEKKVRKETIHQEIKENYTTYYKVEVLLPKELNPFKLSTKLQRFINPKNVYRCICDVEYIGKKQAQCISVSSPSHLYLTDNYIVTHNTFTNSYVLVDEAQNATMKQTELMIGRLGKNSKMVFCGDMSQCDLRDKKGSGFDFFPILEKEVEGVKVITLLKNHRHNIVDPILKVFSSYRN